MSLSLPASSFAQEDDELGEEEDTPPPAAELAQAEKPARPQPARRIGDLPSPERAPAPRPPAPTAPPAPPSPFLFMVRGSATGTVFMQDAPLVTGNGTSALFGPVVYTTDGQFKLLPDNWMLGGDIRSSRISFIIRGPEALGAIPSGLLELELAGGNQVTTVPAPAPATVRNAMGMAIGTVPTVGTSAQGDESLLPRLRTAYVDMTWALGRDVLRVGQFHNLLLTMIAASAARPGTLGYPAGQIGWRSPGITYMRKFMVGEETNFDLALQVNRNSWVDNLPQCPPGMGGPPALSCVPHGVSLGEAASLPQVEARLMLQSGKAESPWLYYAPNVWQAYLVGHWDQKDLSGLGAVAAAPQRDTMQTLLVEGGFKLKLGPVQIAANGWFGQNAYGVYGNVIQFPTPDKDVMGFGAWSQLAFSFTKHWTLWAFAGIDKPDQDDAILAGFTRLQNMQLHGMLSYTDGPIIVGVEWYHVATTNYLAPVTVPGGQPTPALKLVSHANQPSVTVTYLF